MGRQALINRLYAKELLGFSKVDLDFSDGLIVFSGPSGAGKSVLMSAVLASFGMGAAEAKLCEIELDAPADLNADAYDVDDTIVIRSMKKDRVRYYLNDQNIPKKSLNFLMSPHVNYLSVRDNGGFESNKLVNILDNALIQKNNNYKKLLEDYRDRYLVYKARLNELSRLLSDERKLVELIEFTTFEIEKINAINPKIDEDIELLSLKKKLSKIDKINDALAKAEEIFTLEGSVSELFELSDRDGGYFSEMMNQLRVDFDEIQQLSSELEDIDVESLLDRLEKIAELKNRYGSIEEAISCRIKKEKELDGYVKIEENKDELESFLSSELASLSEVANTINTMRIDESKILAQNVSLALSKLKLPKVSFVFSQIELSENGTDYIDIQMSGSKTSTLSGGEYNRLRLVLMVASIGNSDSKNEIIILDEIDANISGDESIAIADMITKLSTHYQIFAISHQPHLAAKANQHILIHKDDHGSHADILNDEGRLREISRIVGGESPNVEAVAFAQKLLLDR